jgi:hypothetical protein
MADFHVVLYHESYSQIVTTVAIFIVKKTKKKTPVAVVCKRTIPTERPPLVGEVSANFCG